jgi:RNA-directed DNA polymerase
MRAIMGKLKLTVNEEKTRICKVPEGEFDFLGYTYGRRVLADDRARLASPCGRRRRVSGAWSKRFMR